MKFHFAKFLVLITFTFWASGFAKFVHEAIEHHGRDASVEEDDDDDSAASVLPASQIPGSPSPAKPTKPPCPVCQMLAAMAVCHSAPSFVPMGVGPLLGTLILPNRVAPPVRPNFARSARDPPSMPSWL